MTEDEKIVYNRITEKLIPLHPSLFKYNFDETEIYAICKSLAKKGYISIKYIGPKYEDGTRDYGVRKIRRNL